MKLEAHLLCQSCLWHYKCTQRLLSLSAAIRSSTSYYDVLGVKPDASLEEIKNAFFDKSKKLHPDSDPSNPNLHAQFVNLNEAYRVLSKEETRKEHDLRLRHHIPRNPVFTSSSRYTHNPSTAEAAEHIRYWGQFRQSQDYTEEERQRRRKKNWHLVGYCIIAMLLSSGVHFFGFRNLQKIHNFMDKKEKPVTEVYSESKERIRVNRFKKQKEILRQKHTEFLERCKIHNSGNEK